MQRYLVVANQTLGGEHLTETVRACLEEGTCRFHLLVPATQPSDHVVWTEGEAHSLAQGRLDAALERFRALGVEATGEVGDERPLDAIRDVMARERFDAIILSTLPAGVSKWLRQDLVHRVERAFDVPVTHLVGEPEPVR